MTYSYSYEDVRDETIDVLGKLVFGSHYDYSLLVRTSYQGESAAYAAMIGGVNDSSGHDFIRAYGDTRKSAVQKVLREFLPHAVAAVAAAQQAVRDLQRVVDDPV